jgi:hypothetical protein
MAGAGITELSLGVTTYDQSSPPCLQRANA